MEQRHVLGFLKGCLEIDSLPAVCADLSLMAHVQKFAEAFSETLFLKFYGNSNEDCKHLIEERLQVPLTPTFTLFRKGTSHISLFSYSATQLVFPVCEPQHLMACGGFCRGSSLFHHRRKQKAAV